MVVAVVAEAEAAVAVVAAVVAVVAEAEAAVAVVVVVVPKELPQA